MARPEIKNLNDLNDYLSLLEDRIAVLDQEDRTIKGAINEVNHNLQANNQPEVLPATGLVEFLMKYSCKITYKKSCKKL